MYEIFILILRQAWKNRQNAFIATGGLAVFFIVLMIALNSASGVPGWLVMTVTIATNIMVAVTIVAMFYHVARFVVRWVIWALREMHVLPQKKIPKNDAVNNAGTILR
jgi:hypothetical protein